MPKGGPEKSRCEDSGEEGSTGKIKICSKRS